MIKKYLFILLVYLLFVTTFSFAQESKYKVVEFWNESWSKISWTKKIYSNNNFWFDITKPVTDNKVINKIISKIIDPKVWYYMNRSKNKNNAWWLYITYYTTKYKTSNYYFTIQIIEYIWNKEYSTTYGLQSNWKISADVISICNDEKAWNYKKNWICTYLCGDGKVNQNIEECDGWNYCFSNCKIKKSLDIYSCYNWERNLIESDVSNSQLWEANEYSELETYYRWSLVYIENQWSSILSNNCKDIKLSNYDIGISSIFTPRDFWWNRKVSVLLKNLWNSYIKGLPIWVECINDDWNWNTYNIQNSIIWLGSKNQYLVTISIPRSDKQTVTCYADSNNILDETNESNNSLTYSW